MTPNPSADHEGETKGQLPTCPSYSPWGSSGRGRVSLESQEAVQHLPPSDHHQLPKQDGAQAVIEQPSSAAWKLRTQGSSSYRAAAVTSSPALPSRLWRSHRQPCCLCWAVPLHGCIMGSVTQPGATELGQCCAQSRGRVQEWLSLWVQVFSCFQLQQRWISPGQYRAGLT